jgi:hypothetical protein
VSKLAPALAGSAAAGSAAKPLKKGVKGAAAPAVSKAEKREGAKDKVKHQRLAGQSGIGSDFKTWKSEAEMVERQQYD